MKGLWLIGRAVLTHRRQGRLCPRRGLRWGWGAAQEGLPARGGDAALIWSRKIKVTGGASGSGRRECAGAKIGPFNLGELGKAPTCRSGGSGTGLSCSPILDALSCSRNSGQPDCAALHSLGPTEGQELSPLHHLRDEARISGRTQTLTHHEPEPYQPPGALATKLKLGKSRPRKGLSLLGAFTHPALLGTGSCLPHFTKPGTLPWGQGKESQNRAGNCHLHDARGCAT